MMQLLGVMKGLWHQAMLVLFVTVNGRSWCGGLGAFHIIAGSIRK